MVKLSNKYRESLFAITPPSPPIYKWYLVGSVSSGITQAMTLPFFSADTSQLVAPSGTSLLSKKVAVIIFVLYSSAWKSVVEPLSHLCIIGSNCASALNVISFVIVYLSFGSPTLLFPSYHPTIAESSVTVISGKVISHEVPLLYILHESSFLPILSTLSPFS